MPAMPDIQVPDRARPRHALIIADGDVQARAELDAAWPGWADAADLVLAADGGFARALALGLTVDLLVGDLDSLDPALAATLDAAGVPVLRSRVDKDESDTELALLEAVRRGASRITVLGAFGGPRLDHALANVWLLAHPGLHGVDVVLLDARTRVALLSGPGAGRAAATRSLAGVAGGLVSLLPLGGDVEGITTHGLEYPLRGETLRTGPARGLSNVRTAPDAAVEVAAGRLLVVETVVAPRNRSDACRAILPPMSMPQAGDLAPEVALPDEHGTIHRLSERQGAWTVVYFYPKDDTPGCTTEACGFRDLHGELAGLDAEVWGISPDGSGSHAAFRAKFGLPFTLLSDEDHAVAEVYGAWGEKKNYGKTYMGIIRSSFLVGPDGRVAKAWPTVKAEGHADAVLAALRAARGA